MQYPHFQFLYKFASKGRPEQKEYSNLREFVVWTEETINAIGLELRIQLDDISRYLPKCND